MNIYDSERCNVIHINSCLHVFHHTQSSQKQSHDFYKLCLSFYIKKIDVVMVSKKIV